MAEAPTYPQTRAGRRAFAMQAHVREILAEFEGVPMEPRVFVQAEARLREWAARYFATTAERASWERQVSYRQDLEAEFQIEVGPDPEQPTTLSVRPLNMFTVLFLLMPALSAQAYQHRHKMVHTFFESGGDNMRVEFDPVTKASRIFAGVMPPPELPMDAATFYGLVGRPPVNDDLDRVSCPIVGGVGHWLCGWCPGHDQPRFECGCRAQESEA